MKSMTDKNPLMVWRDLSDKIEKDKVLDKDEIAWLTALYDEGILYIDTLIADLLEVVDNLPGSDRAMIIITSDNGEELFEHGGWGHGSSLYKEVMHVPLLIRFPQKRWGDYRVGTVVSNASIFNTILDEARVNLKIPKTAPTLSPEGMEVWMSGDGESHSFIIQLENLDSTRLVRPLKFEPSDLFWFNLKKGIVYAKVNIICDDHKGLWLDLSSDYDYVTFYGWLDGRKLSMEQVHLG